MNTRDLGFLICRGLSLYSLVLAAGPAGTAVSVSLAGSGLQYNQYSSPQALVYSVSPALAYLAASVLLWLGAGPLGRAMAGRVESAEPVSHVGDWRLFAVRLVGLLVLALALPQASQFVTALYTSNFTSGIDSSYSSYRTAMLFSEASNLLVKLGVGGWLIAGAPRILRVLERGKRAEPVAQ